MGKLAKIWLMPAYASAGVGSLRAALEFLLGMTAAAVLLGALTFLGSPEFGISS